MFRGKIVALVTPMLSDGAMDYANFERLIVWQLQQGANGIVILGTTGEAATIEKEERAELIRLALNATRRKIPVIVGAGTHATQHTLTLVQQAHALGADAVLLITPYYNKPTQEGLFCHYACIAKTVAIPQILYNVPTRTACDLLPETVLRLSRFSNIVAMKEALPGVERLKRLQALHIPMHFLSGDDKTAMEFMLAGGKGVISVAANVVPHQISALCDTALRGDRKTAEDINQSLISLYDALFIETNPIPTKWMLQKMGFIREGIRLPLTPLSESHHVLLEQVMRVARII